MIMIANQIDIQEMLEATVNTTTTSTTTTNPLSQSSGPPTSKSLPSSVSNHNKTSGGGTAINEPTDLLGSASNTNNNIITNSIGHAVLARLNKNSNTDITGGSGIMANTTTSKAQNMAQEQNSNSSTTTATTSDQAATNATSNGETSPSKEDPCAALLGPDTKVNNNSTSANNNETARYFDIDYASRTFQDSMNNKNAISLCHYLNGFKELMKFFHSLGSIFLFVTSDLESKIGLLEGYRNTEKGGCNPAYLTIQSAVDYETKENLLRDSKRQSGARTILRLHRALEFLSSLMLNLSKLESDAETAPSAREAYSNTLAKHHPWTIRTLASFAMRTLPHKKTLVESVLGKDYTVNETLTNEKMLKLANVTETLFNVIDRYYDELDLKDLP